MDSNMSTLWIGFLSGFIASLAFFLLIRLLPARWVRYQVSFGELIKEGGVGPQQWLLTVRLDPPKWKRILMDPLRESLLVQVRLGRAEWLQSKWVEGDINILRLAADATMSVPALVFTESSGVIYIADSYPDNPISQDGSYDIWVRIIRNVDNSGAGEIGTDLAKETADLVLTDDNYVHIPQAVSVGRKALNNSRKGLTYYLSAKAILISIFIVPLILRIPFPFAPIHIILTELLMDLTSSLKRV